jgi:nucleotide-binding universal stress UspA family protein
VSEIVVGLDLSPSAGAAIRWAAEQARATGQALRAVHVIHIAPAYSMALGMAGAMSIEPSEVEAPYREAVAAVFDSVQPDAGWQLKFVSGEVGPSLVAESIGAALLVVGTKEHVGIGRLVYGSVSHYCLSHAQCPMVAVQASRDQGAAGQDQASADASDPAGGEQL